MQHVMEYRGCDLMNLKNNGKSDSNINFLSNILFQGITKYKPDNPPLFNNKDTIFLACTLLLAATK